ncbi:RNA-binding cell elongation regulator Jag/EloR [Clostridium sp. LIBA-8841]|uniref:RNA-binding cell elongation regulator Jag/EloR n=1 Tax=Clostridium sp. LIBA-8841 TaxID=2987530 RepID=UPI002AC445F5|nr:RNA-binding cell elongation regulator Jag/EloR [Clostridium sp. LIBA-8841]MDZ5254877.1 protein jag [Clostridium sp. LIBA-8841]
MKTIEITGKTVEEALKSALRQLGTTEDKVEVTVIDGGSKGFFNLIGTKPAKISVTMKRDRILETKKFLSEVLEKMNVKAEINIEESNDTVKINITGPKMGSIIGYRGETLDSLQYLTSLVVNKSKEDKYKRVVLDTENYRQKREETLKRLANKIAYKVRKSGKNLKLEPMNPYERRVIHSELQNNDFVKTFSEGEEPYRRVVVELKK